MYVFHSFFLCNLSSVCMYFFHSFYPSPLFLLFFFYPPPGGPTFVQLFDVYIPLNKPINTNKYIYIIHQSYIHTPIHTINTINKPYIHNLFILFIQSIECMNGINKPYLYYLLNEWMQSIHTINTNYWMFVTIPSTHQAWSPAVALSGNRVRPGLGCVPGIVYPSHPSSFTVFLISLPPLPYLHSYVWCIYSTHQTYTHWYIYNPYYPYNQSIIST